MAADFFLSLLRFGYIVLLWVFILSTVAFLRRDIFGFGSVRKKPTTTTPKAPVAPATAPATAPVTAPVTAPKPSDPSLPPAIAKVPQIGNIRVTAGVLKGTVIGVQDLEEGDQFTIGRLHDQDITIDDDYLSSMHARIFKADGSFYIEDLNSTNGTLLNMIKLTKPAKLKVDDQIQIGLNVLSVER